MFASCRVYACRHTNKLCFSAALIVYRCQFLRSLSSRHLIFGSIQTTHAFRFAVRFKTADVSEDYFEMALTFCTVIK